MDFQALQTRVIERIDESSTPTWWTLAEVKLAINKAQRFFAFLTLAVERTASFAIDTNAFYTISTSLSDFILPLKIYNAAGSRVYPYKLYELQQENPAWRSDAGSPTKYAQAGFDLLAITKQPASSENLSFTYAATPTAMSGNTDTPEIPEEHHPALIKFAIYYLRLKEGGADLQSVLPLLNEFLDEAQKFGEFTRARSKAQQYDAQPFDLASFDRSRLIKLIMQQSKAAKK